MKPAKFTPEQLATNLLASCISKAIAIQQANGMRDNLKAMLAKAEATGRKVGGYTAEQLRESVAHYTKAAELVAA